MVVEQGIALVTGIITLVGIWQAGNGRARGWAIGLGNQVLWFTFIVAFRAWGLLPLGVSLTFVYTRNLLRWRRHGAPI